MHQIGIPIELHLPEVRRKHSLGAAIDLCLEAAGLEPKVVQSDLRLDKAQFSRWSSGTEGVTWPKLAALMDRCGNDAPLLWMLHARGYDLASLRKQQTETERELELAREQIKQLQAERVIELRLMRDLRVAA